MLKDQTQKKSRTLLFPELICVFLLGPPTPRVSQRKNFVSGPVEFEVLMCGGLCMKFLAAIFPGN